METRLYFRLKSWKSWSFRNFKISSNQLFFTKMGNFSSNQLYFHKKWRKGLLTFNSWNKPWWKPNTFLMWTSWRIHTCRHMKQENSKMTGNLKWGGWYIIAVLYLQNQCISFILSFPHFKSQSTSDEEIEVSRSFHN